MIRNTNEACCRRFWHGCMLFIVKLKPNRQRMVVLYILACMAVILTLCFERDILLRIGQFQISYSSYFNSSGHIHESEQKRNNLPMSIQKVAFAFQRQFEIGERESEKRAPICDIEKTLLGRQTILANVSAEKVKDPKALERVKKGGTFTPQNCTPRESVAIIIPYRDRQKHLEIFINHIHAFLQRQQLKYGIFVVELARPTTFNRGLLANVGFLEAQRTGLYSCYVIHDVDLLPLNDRNIYNCSSQFRHLSVVNSKFKNKLPYKGYVGGVSALREDVYVKINGFSNLFFGWGGEDDDFSTRATKTGIHLERPHKDIGVYVALPHKGDVLNPLNPDRWKLLKEWKKRHFNDGINSMNYQELSITAKDLYTVVYVKVNKSEVMQRKIVKKVGDREIYESDLKTLDKKRAPNDKIINAYLLRLQERNQTKILSLNSTFVYLKKPWFPNNLNTSKVELIFIPVKTYGHWTLIVIYRNQNSVACLDPTDTCNQDTVDLIRNEYRIQENISLSYKKNVDQEMYLDKNRDNSGIIIAMYAKRLAERKPLSFKQSDIDAARVEIETCLKGK